MQEPLKPLTAGRPWEWLTGRIDLALMLKCGTGGVFNHGSNESAVLLPKARPFSEIHFTFMLYLDKLTLPYELPVGKRKGEQILKRNNQHGCDTILFHSAGKSSRERFSSRLFE
jgi:hypothetical protein